MQTFPETLRGLRSAAGISQKQLGHAIGVSRQTIGLYERMEEPTIPLRYTVLRIAEALELTPLNTDRLLAAAGYGPEYSVSPGETHGLLHLEEARVQHLVVERLDIAPPSLEQQRRLQSMICDHNDLMATRLERFVGRTSDLAEIRALIDQSKVSGGYVVVTGQAGQGKTSIMARLVADYGPSRVAHHFIPLAPVSGYEVILLRDVIARLALKHTSVAAVVDDTSLPVLSQHLEQVLQRLAEQGRPEILFIDGLDQLPADGETPDLSFLPAQLRPGIVIVLTTRSDATLMSLAPMSPKQFYALPRLSQDDFVELLRQRGIALSLSDVGHLHIALHGHALYLDLAARLLAEDDAPEIKQIVERVDVDPEGLFSLSIERFRRHGEWRNTIKPILALLTAARAPISTEAIKHLCRLDFERTRAGLERLGGLIERDSAGRAALYHEKLRAFLTSAGSDRRTPFDASEIRTWHARLANWGLDRHDMSASSWPDPDREHLEAERAHYADDHLPAHVLHAHDDGLLTRLLAVDPTSDEEVARLERRLRALQQETRLRIEEGEFLLLQHVLPLGVGPLSANPSTQWAASGVRRAFRRWLDQYPEMDRVRIRDAALDLVRDRLTQAPTPGACWLVSALGFRREDVTTALWMVAERYDDEIGDSALAALANTGAAGAAVDRFRAMVGDRGTRRWNTSLRAAFRRCADAGLVEIIRRHWLTATDDVLPDIDRTGVLEVLATTAERDPSGRMADVIWELLSEQTARDPETYIPELRLNSGIVGKCDSARVIPSMLGLLDQAGEHAARHRELIYRRLADCVRPRQLTGWEQPVPPAIRAIIQSDACQDSKARGRWHSVDVDCKLLAWDTAFCLNLDDLLDWIEPTLAAESNPDVAGYLMHRLACLRLPDLPPVVQRWLTEPFAKQTSSEDEWSRRVAALHIARSSPSPATFAALLHCGLHVDESALQRTADALADVACALARRGNTTIGEQLITTYRDSPHHYHRSTAAQAIATLAAERLVSGYLLMGIAETLDDEERSPLERGYVVAALGHARDLTLAQEFVDQLARWGRDRADDWLGLFALEALARRGDLRAYPDVLTDRLGLQPEGDGWVYRPRAGQRDDLAAYYMRLLYERHPDEFTDTVAAWIVEGEWYDAEPIVDHLVDRRRANGDPVPPAIQKALITRVLQRQRRDYAEREMIQCLDVIAPELLLDTDWPAYWGRWWSISRAVLADAIGRATQIQPDRAERAGELLQSLTHDAEYEVRRAAYRAWARCAPQSLRQACELWVTMHDTNARMRAAEALAWLPVSDEAAQPLAAQLADDPEGSIREAIATAEQERQEHVWAEDYLARIEAMAATSDANVLSVYCYGAALTKGGDDETIRVLNRIVEEPTVAPHVRHWLRQLIIKLEERWKKMVTSWKGRWIPALEAVVEEDDGQLIHPSGSTRRVRYRVWRSVAPTVGAIPSWGGIVTPEEDFRLWNSSAGVTLRFSDGREGQVWVPSFMGDQIQFLGESPYPNQTAELTL